MVLGPTVGTPPACAQSSSSQAPPCLPCRTPGLACARRPGLGPGPTHESLRPRGGYVGVVVVVVVGGGGGKGGGGAGGTGGGRGGGTGGGVSATVVRLAAASEEGASRAAGFMTHLLEPLLVEVVCDEPAAPAEHEEAVEAPVVDQIRHLVHLEAAREELLAQIRKDEAAADDAEVPQEPSGVGGSWDGGRGRRCGPERLGVVPASEASTRRRV